MENSEANKIIAEFMDFEYPVKNDSGFFMPNTDFMSLDALVPVWEKLSKEWHFEMLRGVDDFIVGFERTAYKGEPDEITVRTKDSIQQAAAIATAKAILEMKK